MAEGLGQQTYRYIWSALCRMDCLPLGTDLASSQPTPHLSFSPDAADSSSFDVELGDIILTASDGLFDNMPDYMILRELKKLKVPLQECKYFHTVSTGRKLHLTNVILSACDHFRLPAMIASCRLHRALHSKLMTLPTTPTICPRLHSLPVIMA